jgi:hypothetical protein
VTAATVVSATGALLLLAAAATFLAVSWDSLGLTARVAVVAAATAGAIVGGARLRRTLPAVGAVVFHLGALLVPVDALGLALQLEVGPATTWTAVGATAVGALGVAAVAGRSRVLAVGALAGVPVLATGLGSSGGVSAPLLTAAAALVAVAAVRPLTAGGSEGRADASVDDPGADPARPDPRDVLDLAPALLALAAVVGPLLVAVGTLVDGGGVSAPLRAAAAAGWWPETWTGPAGAGTLAVAALVAAVLRRRSPRWAATIPVLVVLVAATLLLPGDAPRLARALPVPVLFLTIEAVAVGVRGDRVLAPALDRVAAAAEVLAALWLPATLAVVAGGGSTWSGEVGGRVGELRLVADPVLATVAVVTALAWGFVAHRRGRATALGLAATGAALASSAAALTWLAPSVGAGVVLCLAAVLGFVAVRGGGARGTVASAVTVVLGSTALAGTWRLVGADLGWSTGRAEVPIGPGGPVTAGALVTPAVWVTLASGLVALAVAGRLREHGRAGEGRDAAILLVPVLGAAVLVAASATGAAWGFGTSLVVAVVLLLAAATVVEVVPVAADVLRVVAATVALLAEPVATGGLEAAWIAAPAASLVVTVLVGEVLVAGRRPWLLVLAGPVLVRAVAGLAVGVTGTRTGTGAALLALAVVAGLVVVRPGRFRLPGVVTAATAGVPAVALLSLTPEALAWATVAVGVAVVAGGVLARRPGVAHTGGVVATLGVWQLLAIAEVTAVDVWLLAPAVQLWLVGLPARREGRLSSWVVDVPPLLLVVVPALVERLAGGSGWHAALAGTVAVLAVVSGGAGRHGGPLVVGALAVVAVALVETLAVVAAVPTWAWLTVGGGLLLAVGASIERTDGGPVEGTRRLVDALAERFD